MPFRILKIKFPKGAWRKPLFYKKIKNQKRKCRKCIGKIAKYNKENIILLSKV